MDTKERENVVGGALFTGWQSLELQRLSPVQRLVLAHMWMSVAVDEGVVARSEAELADRMNLSPHVIRNALGCLRQWGFIAREYVSEDGSYPVAQFSVVPEVSAS
jgi:hypothetical protein